MTTTKYEESFKDLKSNKPTFPITTPSKLSVGILSMIFAGALVFVLIEKTQ